jgi:hypothetical protein
MDHRETGFEDVNWWDMAPDRVGFCDDETMFRVLCTEKKNVLISL